jgi:hypothetical protein
MADALSLSAPQKAPITVSFDIPGSATAGSPVFGDIFQNGINAPSVNTGSVPYNEVWYLVDLDVNSSLTIDMIVQLYIGTTLQAWQPDLNQYVIGNAGRAHLSESPNYAGAIAIPANATFYMTGYLQNSNTLTTAVTESVTFQFVREPLNMAISRAKNGQSIAL